MWIQAMEPEICGIWRIFSNLLAMATAASGDGKHTSSAR